MHLSIVAPTGRLFHGQVSSITLPGSMGTFQVLNNHAPILSALTAGVVNYVMDGTLCSTVVQGGFASVADNNAVVVCHSVVECA